MSTQYPGPMKPFAPRLKVPSSDTGPQTLSAKLLELTLHHKVAGAWFAEKLKPLAAEAYKLERRQLDMFTYGWLGGFAVGAIIVALLIGG